MKKVYAMYFSATGTTKKTVTAIANSAAKAIDAEYEEIDFTLPAGREREYSFSENDLVIFGTPVYAGRVPNVLLKFLNTIKGGGAFAVPVVSYGNRNYDDALIEIRNILEDNGFKTMAAGAFIGEHSFSYTLAAGRPNEEDIKTAENFGIRIAQKLLGGQEIKSPIKVKGETPIRPYYVPKDRQKKPVDIRKVTSKVNEKCTNCGICAGVCPMGSISKENAREYKGICIKCGACIKKCPVQARYYDSESYLYHKTELELEFAQPKKIEIFI